MDDAKIAFRKAIEQLIDLNEEEWLYYSSHLKIKTYKKNEFVLNAGKRCNEVFFINSGLLRVFFTDKDGNEATFHFSMENDFASDYESFLLRKPSKYYIQAMENTEIIVMSHWLVNDGYQKLKNGEKLGRQLAEKYFIIFSNKIQSIYTQTPLERYKQMSEQFPGILQRIPQHYIASYLNITPVHLSRLKKECN